MANQDTTVYVDLMLYRMGAEGPGSMTIRESVPLAPLTQPVLDDERESIVADFPAVLRRLKHISNVDPEATGAIEGKIEMRIATQFKLTIRSELDDTCDDPFCRLTIMEKKTYNQ
ncbi:MAG: hypothetical protein HN742_37055 [Lentisphaerae bacterium]|jgi:hypothetical protein|nr:hypothetical protein [Lentisphaerota bacterium]MBT4822177.1 hypothetical protein [Lentisphaerota bacterium]MBT5609012.1 hypothetical protein [Lentisphaerota bacterium]MBT7057456.1 hypothetical protein [Lentisphaerota bacterium]MBT7847536.1 hypothetical protein [Lentisphaerota bacterium]